ncbi:MAG: phosphate ABC transporter substrate-binding protein [Gammaproteobacteria bacterium]|nr:phosphate ABC transporter substrate-binding protein [Gammaproteobacteria bacterium]
MKARQALLLILVLAAHLTAWAGEIYIVSHPTLSIRSDEVRDIYNGDKQLSAGVKLVLVDNALIQTDFLARVVKLSIDKYNSLWIKKSFRDGISIPQVKSGDAEVIAFIKSNPGAIGYISKPHPELKTIAHY